MWCGIVAWCRIDKLSAVQCMVSDRFGVEFLAVPSIQYDHLWCDVQWFRISPVAPTLRRRDEAHPVSSIILSVGCFKARSVGH